MGLRQTDLRPRLSPVSRSKDVGRRPLRNIGTVDINLVIPDPEQPRTDFDEEAIARLAASIRDKGQLHPIRVRWDEALDRWIIISGERRYRATRAAGLPNIDCYFHEDGISPSEVLEQQLVENLLREDLKPLEEARAFSALMELNAWTGKQVAEALRLSPSRVSRALALLALPESLQQRIEAGELGKTAAYELTKLDNEESRERLADQVAEHGFTHEQAARAVRQRKGKKKRVQNALSQSFLSENGVKVTVSSAAKVTYHEIEQALDQALEEVRHRIRNNVQLF
jgi:ParB family transcriptional regulator, chromosome partitioning protein